MYASPTRWKKLDLQCVQNSVNGWCLVFAYMANTKHLDEYSTSDELVAAAIFK
jgi:hypothetical protein